MDPIDYTSAFNNLPNPTQAFMQGLQAGTATNDVLAGQQQQQAKLAQQKQLQADLAELSQNPTTDGIAKLSLKYPQLSEQFKRSFDILEPQEQRARLEQATPVYMALHNNRPDVAVSELRKQAQAFRNAGKEDSAKAAESKAQMIEQDPKAAQVSLGGLLSAAIGPDKFAKMLGDLGAEQRASDQAPAELRLKTAEASAAEAKSDVAVATAPQQIQKASIDNRVTELDAQIRVANSQTERDKLQLERDKLTQQQADKATDAGAAAQGQLDTAQQALDTVKKLATDPLLDSSFGVGSAIGKIASYIPGSDNKDYRAQLETLKAQLFLPAVAQLKAAGGGGGLSDAEGKKLSAAVAALDADMSPKAFKNALGVVQKYLEQGYQKALASKKLPTSGGAFVVKHPTFGAVNEGDINRLLKMYPGATREQVMSYLQTTGGQ